MTRSILALFGAFTLMACGNDFEAKGNDPKPDSGTGGATGGSGGSAGSSTGGTSGTGGSSTGGSGGSPNGCPANHRCVPPAPSGWSGPYALTSDPTCPASWGQQQLVVHDQLTADPPECGCTCTPETNCPNTAGLIGSNNASCPTTPTGTPVSLTVGSCKDANGLLVHGVVIGEATPSCKAQVAKSIPPAVWAVNDRLCAGAGIAGQCENAGDSCYPSEGVSLCIEQAGDVPCSGAYAGKHLYFTDLEDTRNCPDSCPCSGAGPVECTAYFHAFTLLQCGGAATAGSVKSGAVACVGGSPAVTVDSIAPSKFGSCTPGAVIGSGEVAPLEPHTVCCLQ